LGAMTLTLTSCDDCKDVTCENGGTCAEGVCECPADYYGDMCEVMCMDASGTYSGGACTCDVGYEGDGCETESRAKFIASYSYTTACAPGSSFNSDMTSVTDNVQRVTITNLTGFNDKTAYGVVEGSKISVPSQTVTDEDSDTWIVESTSSATIADGKFNLTIKGTIGGQSITCDYSYSAK